MARAATVAALALLLTTLLGACATSPGVPEREPNQRSAHGPWYTGGDGTSYEQAVFFPGASTSMEGIPLETRWIDQQYPGYVKSEQAIRQHEDGLYDVITILGPDGDEVVLYFNMSDWFGY